MSIEHAGPTILELEEAFLAAWPALETVHDGAWVWRWADGYSKRSNSVQSLDVSDDGDAAARIARLAERSRGKGIAPVFRMTPLAGPGIVAALDGAGWETFEESHVLARALDGPEPGVADGVQVFAPADPAWSQAYADMSGYRPAALAGLRGVLGAIHVPAAGLMLLDDAGRPMATALALKAGRIGVTLNVVVDPSHRGRGLGRRIMRAALDWQRAAGATWAGIQVVASNAPARALYAGLGYAHRYVYTYRRPVQP